jgi:hypothetical protein
VECGWRHEEIGKRWDDGNNGYFWCSWPSGRFPREHDESRDGRCGYAAERGVDEAGEGDRDDDDACEGRRTKEAKDRWAASWEESRHRKNRWSERQGSVAWEASVVANPVAWEVA